MCDMTCPVCGKKFNNMDADFLDNGNPACKDCAMEERNNDEFSKNNKNLEV